VITRNIQREGQNEGRKEVFCRKGPEGVRVLEYENGDALTMREKWIKVAELRFLQQCS
jgi:hypothetical protein